MQNRIKIVTYKKSGDRDKEYFYDNIQDALKAYVTFRAQVPDFRNRPAWWPTIWVNTENGFQRVHGFAFKELTPETLGEYLGERIIDTDYLLAAF